MIRSGPALLSQRRLFSFSKCRRNVKLSGSISKFLEKHDIQISEEEIQHDYQEPILAHLKRRGLVENCVNEEELIKDAESRKLGLYCGADPTAKSLHLGGATGEVGDPSGRSTERSSMASDVRQDHIGRISGQLSTFFSKAIKYGKTRNPQIAKQEPGTTELQNNKIWWKEMGMLEFLAIYGKHIRVNQMLSRESIKNRLNSDQGIGFNEFTYQILQAYDFYYLNENLGVDIEVGGNDQYGNIVAGLDLISRMKKAEESKNKNQAYGITVPLLTTSNGVKFGKSAGNALFIDKELTSSYDIYQFMYNTTDEDIQKFLYKFSLLPTKIIDKVVDVHSQDKKSRFGQTVLAIEMCDLIHGDGEGLHNHIISEILFSKVNVKEKFKADEILNAFENQGLVTRISKEEVSSTNIVNLLHQISNGEKSKSELRRMIKAGSLYIGNTKEGKVSDVEYLIDLEKDTIEDKLLLLKLGKKYYVVKIE